MSTHPRAEKKSIPVAWIVLLIFAAFLLIRLPFRADFLLNWDSVNFALGSHLFDLETHQPHPPGYIGYVFLTWLLNFFTGDANSSMTLLSALGGAAAPAAFFLFASLFVTRGYALAGSVLLGVSPVVSYYSAVALTYSLELALGLFFLWAGYVARKRLSMPHLLAATAILVALGAVRQTGGLLLTPLWLYLVWSFPWQERIRAGTVLVAGNLAWMVPMFWLSGGVARFFEILGQQMSLAVAPTSVLSMDGGAMSQNLLLVGIGIVMGANFGLLILAASVFRGRSAYRVFREDAAFFGIWLAPALATFLFLHTGQVGYVLLVLPFVFLAMAVGLKGVVEGDPGGRPATGKAAAPAVGAGAGAGAPLRYAGVGLVGALTLGSAALFLSVPPAIAGTTEDAQARDGRFGGLAEVLPAFRFYGLMGGYFTEGWRQYHIAQNDLYWSELTGLLEGYDPERTVILSTPSPFGSFRHLTYYAPDHRVYGIGRDLSGGFGHLYTAEDRTSDYTVPGLRESADRIQLPNGAERAVIPDPEVQDALRAGSDLVTREIRLATGDTVLVAELPAGATLSFSGGATGPLAATVTGNPVTD